MATSFWRLPRRAQLHSRRMPAVRCALVVSFLPCAAASSAASSADLRRAVTRTPSALYRGDDFASMSEALNGHLAKMPGLTTKPCSLFTAEDIQESVLAPIFQAASPELLTIYSLHADNRQRVHSAIEDLRAEWSHMQAHSRDSHHLQGVHRDGLCHEAVMWFVHHLTQETRKTLSPSLVLPLLPTQRHSLHTDSRLDPSALAIHASYETKVSCQQCHSGPVWKSWVNATLPPPLPVDEDHPGLERLRSCDYQNDPPCGPCDGLGGARWSDAVGDFTPLNCTIVAHATDVPDNQRPKPAFPAHGHANIDGETRSPLETRPSKPGKYPTVNSTISLAWDGEMARHRYDFVSLPPLGMPSSQIYLQRVADIKSGNSSGVMVTIMGREGHLSLCICMDAVAGIMNINSFVPHMQDDPLDLPASEGGLNYLGRVKLAPIDGGERREMIADHYVKWAFHFLVDADPGSTSYGMPLRLYAQQGVRFVYSNWTTQDPRTSAPSFFDIPKWCVPMSQTCREMRESAVELEVV